MDAIDELNIKYPRWNRTKADCWQTIPCGNEVHITYSISVFHSVFSFLSDFFRFLDFFVHFSMSNSIPSTCIISLLSVSVSVSSSSSSFLSLSWIAPARFGLDVTSLNKGSPIVLCIHLSVWLFFIRKIRCFQNATLGSMLTCSHNTSPESGSTHVLFAFRLYFDGSDDFIQQPFLLISILSTTRESIRNVESTIFSSLSPPFSKFFCCFSIRRNCAIEFRLLFAHCYSCGKEWFIWPSHCDS